MSPDDDDQSSYMSLESPATDLVGLWHAAREFSNLVDRRIGQSLHGTGLSPRTFVMLHWVDRLTDKTLSSIRARAGVSASEATRQISSLMRAGYVTTSPSDDDRRTIIVEITGSGKRISRRMFRLVMADLGRFSALGREFDRCDRQLRDLTERIARGR
jgi:DNA-binding MarR family transcriptional regulator